MKDVAGDWHWALRVSLVTAWEKLNNMLIDSSFSTFKHPVFKAVLTLPSLQEA